MKVFSTWNHITGLFRFSPMGFKFEKLVVWQKALDLADIVYSQTRSFPKEELFALSAQLKRAADSVSLNIAEGSTSQSNAEQNRFLAIALRSNIEVVACLYLAKRRKYITAEDFEKIYRLCEEILALISGLRRSISLSQS